MRWTEGQCFPTSKRRRTGGTGTTSHRDENGKGWKAPEMSKILCSYRYFDIIKVNVHVRFPFASLF